MRHPARGRISAVPLTSAARSTPWRPASCSPPSPRDSRGADCTRRRRRRRSRPTRSSGSACTRLTGGSRRPALPLAWRVAGTAHSGHVSLAVELTDRDGSTRAVQLAGGWKGPATLFRYTAFVTTGHEAVSRYLHPEGPAERKGAAGRQRSPRREKPRAGPTRRISATDASVDRRDGVERPVVSQGGEGSPRPEVPSLSPRQRPPGLARAAQARCSPTAERPSRPGFVHRYPVRRQSRPRPAKGLPVDAAASGPLPRRRRA